MSFMLFTQPFKKIFTKLNKLPAQMKAIIDSYYEPHYKIIFKLF